MNTSEVLNVAADLIEERGWGKGAQSWNTSEGSALCLEGAIGAALGKRVNCFGPNGISPDDLNVCPAGEAVRNYLNEFFEERPKSWLCHWNDDFGGAGRTAEQVIEVLRATALIESAKESEMATVA